MRSFEARNLQPEDYDGGVQLLWKNSDVLSKLTCLDVQYHSGLSAEDTLTNWHSRMVAFFFRDQKPPKNIQLPSLMLTMQVVANKTWFCECNQIIQNDSVWGDCRYRLSTPICVEALENGNGEEPLRGRCSRGIGIGLTIQEPQPKKVILDASRAYEASSKSFYISQPRSFMETWCYAQLREKMDLHWCTLPLCNQSTDDVIPNFIPLHEKYIKTVHRTSNIQTLT